MGGIGGFKRLIALVTDGFRQTVMDHRLRHQVQARVIMVVVVPIKERLCPTARIDQRSKTLWKIGTIFECLELGFGVRIVIRRIGVGMRFGHAQIRQQRGHGLGPHRTAPVGVQGHVYVKEN